MATTRYTGVHWGTLGTEGCRVEPWDAVPALQVVLETGVTLQGVLGTGVASSSLTAAVGGGPGGAAGWEAAGAGDVLLLPGRRDTALFACQGHWLARLVCSCPGI